MEGSLDNRKIIDHQISLSDVSDLIKSQGVGVVRSLRVHVVHPYTCTDHQRAATQCVSSELNKKRAEDFIISNFHCLDSIQKESFKVSKLKKVSLVGREQILVACMYYHYCF